MTVDFNDSRNCLVFDEDAFLGKADRISQSTKDSVKKFCGVSIKNHPS